jgi:hypothetical protein
LKGKQVTDNGGRDCKRPRDIHLEAFFFRLAFAGCAASVVKKRKMINALRPPTGRFI